MAPLGLGATYEAAHAAVDAAADVMAAVIAVRDLYQVDHVTYHLAQMIGGIADGPYVKSTYPAHWLTRYLISGYVRKDPVLKSGFSLMLPFDWRELPVDDDAIEVMTAFTEHGLGGYGYSIPIVDKLARRALISINDMRDEAGWTHFIKDNATGLADIAHKLHQKAILEIHGDKDPLPRLARRELECLTWAAQGKTAKEIGRLMGLSDATVRDYLLSARLKLDCSNLTQAIAKAVSLRVINPNP